MTLHVLPLGRPGAPAPAAPQRVDASDAAGAGFAQVFELEAARRARQDRIPPEVLDEVDAASRLYDELRAEGLNLRFAAGELDRRVVVDLCDTEGNVLRPISLTDAIDRPLDPGPTAA